MGKQSIIAAFVVAITGFLTPAQADAPTNPLARQATCTLAVTWDPGDPEAVQLRYIDHRLGGPVTACGATEDLAIATALRELIRR